jgi:hypothetical protein
MRSPSADLPPRHPSSGAIRPSGVIAAMVTAGVVFGVGMLILPPVEPELPPAPIVAPPTPPPPPPMPPSAPVTSLTTDAASASDAATASSNDAPPSPLAAALAPAPEAVAPAPKPEPVGTAPKPEPVGTAPKPTPEAAPEAIAPAPKPEAAPAAKPEAAASAPDAVPPRPDGTAPHEKLADKDVAREAWRKNLPDITPEAGKAAILVPIKGSIEGATYHVTVRPRSVLVTLPKGESMITMPFYNIRHDGFRQLWIKKDDDTAATTIRIVLGENVDPQVEIKDDFVRVTIRRPTEGAAAAGTSTPAPSAAAASSAATAPASAPTPAAASPTPAAASPTPPAEAPTPPPTPPAHD